MARIITEDNWLEVVMNALEELEGFYKASLFTGDIVEIKGKQKELEALIKFLNKTN